MLKIDVSNSESVSATPNESADILSNNIISITNNNTNNNSSENIMNEILDILYVNIETDNENSNKKKNIKQKKNQAGFTTKKYENIFSSNKLLKDNIPDKFTRNQLQFKLHKLADHFKKLIEEDDLKLKQLNKQEGDDKKRKRSQLDNDEVEEDEDDSLKKFKKSADEALKHKHHEANIPQNLLEEHKKRMENDPLYNNPKSEYVQAQSLPKVVSLMGLFNEDERQKKEKFPNAVKKLNYLRAKYGVSRFPKRDLIADLPAKFPDLDLTQPKPANQIQFSTFLSYIDPYFRQYVDKDEDFLMQNYVVPNRILTTKHISHSNVKDTHSFENLRALESTFDELNENKIYDPNLTPYMIPKLGKFYYLKWFEENFNIITLLNNSSNSNSSDTEYGHNSELKQLISKFPGHYNHIPQIVLPKGDSSVFLKNDANSTTNNSNGKGKGRGGNKKSGSSNKDDENNEKGLDMDNSVSLGPLSTRLIQCIMTDVNLIEENDNIKNETVKPEEADNSIVEINENISLESMEEKIKKQLLEKKRKVKSENNSNIGENDGEDEDAEEEEEDDDEEEEEDEDEEEEDEEEDDEFDEFDEFGEDENVLIDEDEDGFEEIFEADANNTKANLENSDQNGSKNQNLVETSTVPFSWKIENPKILSSLNYMSFEERIRQELKNLGVFGVANKSLGKTETENEARNDIDWVLEKEDDEVCSNLRKLQVKLRAVSQRNNQRKQVLRPILKKYLAFQDYAQILENLNKQVDHEYARRLKNSHTKKKKKTNVDNHAATAANIQDLKSSHQFQMQQQEIQHGIADVNLKKLLEKRKKWMDFIGIIFANDESDEEEEDYENEKEQEQDQQQQEQKSIGEDNNLATENEVEKVPKKIKKYMVSENDFLMDGVEEIGAQSLDPAANMKRPPRKSVFKNMK